VDRGFALGIVEERKSFASAGTRNTNGPTCSLAAKQWRLLQLELGNVKFSIEVLNGFIIVGY
jgi:hypothetical protein